MRFYQDIMYTQTTPYLLRPADITMAPVSPLLSALHENGQTYKNNHLADLGSCKEQVELCDPQEPTPSIRTIRRRLLKAELYVHRSLKKSMCFEKNHRTLVEWAKAYKD
ncbi:hypothetical protein Trydic_g23116 [Trypoxylus dichotomus]